MNPFHNFVASVAQAVADAKTVPLGESAVPNRPALPDGAPTVMIFSPHPDDEVIIGGLAVRLNREAHWRVVNVAVTQGSKKERQAERFEELRHCCECIGFDLVQTAPNGLEGVNPKTRAQDPAVWQHSVQVIATILQQHQPRLILFPHDSDWNSTHVGTHFLVMDALKRLPALGCYIAETEFWGQMTSPNLMVELSVEQLSEMITALTCHVGEVQRNPYHLSLPAWMIDNVRRGAELVGGQGGAAPDYPFATLYRLQRWHEGRLQRFYSGGKQITARDLPSALLS